MLQLRYYQEQALNNFFDYTKNNHGKHPVIVLPTGCVSWDTIINENRCTLGRKKQIDKMYKAFNGLNKSSYRNYDKKHKTFVRSFNGETIQLNEVESISYSGIKDLYLLELENDKSIKATSDHKIMTKEGWKKLIDLSENDYVMCDTLKAKKNNNNKYKTNIKHQRNYDKMVWNLWFHPYAQKVNTNKEKRGYSKRIEIHRAIFEAHINNLSFDKYKKILKTDENLSKRLLYVDPSIYDIHHIDHNHNNNDIKNLKKMTKSEHQRLHSEKNKYNFGQGFPEYSKVKSISYYGKDHAYDIGCYENHNFVANGIVVHNSGKSLVIAHIIKKIYEHPGTRILMLTHQQELIKQNYDELLENFKDEIDIDIGIYSAGLKQRDTKNRIIFAGIQSVYQKAWHLGWFDVVLVDECHMIPHKNSGMYRMFFNESEKINKNIVIGGLSATPYRMKDGLLTEGEENLFDDICHETSVKELIQLGFLSKLISKNATHKVDLSNVHVRGGEYISKEMENAFMSGDLVCQAVKEIIEYTQNRKKVLIFTAGIDHCHEVQEKMSILGVKSEVVHSKQSNELNQKNISAFRDGNLKFLVNVNVLTTGFNVKNIDCIALLRSTMSPGLYYQICIDSETEILTKRGFLNIKNIKNCDIPYSFNIEKNEIEEDVILNITKRDRMESEKMFSFINNHVNFRITEDHDLLLRSRRGVKYKKEKVSQAIKRSDFIEIPSSGIQKARGTHLRECEIEFLGWFLSDGSLSKKTNAITISQSITNIEFCNEIQNVLEKCNIKYSKYIIKRNNKYNDQIIFNISKGKPRKKDKDKTGWEHLESYIDKNMNENYNKMNEYEFEILLKTIDKGDGAHKKTLDYNPKTYRLAMGDNKKYAENFQSLCIRRGFRCSITEQKQQTNWCKNPKTQYLLYVKKTNYSTIPGKNIQNGTINNKKPYKRNKIKEEKNFINEKVWCIETKNSTIITRRNGKVVIMGNCGRGLRTHPEKTDCLVLDFGRNVETHGPIDKIEIRKKKEGGSRPAGSPVKECPECHSMIHPTVMICPDCGYRFPEQPKHEEKASEKSVISEWKKPEEIKIAYVKYWRHEKKGKPDSLRVDYHVGDFLKYSTWVCLDHTGYARTKALQWLRNVTDIDINSVDEALDYCDNFKTPKKIIVDTNNKFPEITGYLFDEIEENEYNETIEEEKPIVRETRTVDEALEQLLF